MIDEATSNRPAHGMNVCLATVTTEPFIPGTLVMLHSFLRQNPWFHGDIVVIHDALDTTSCHTFTKGFDRVRFLPISTRLNACLQALIAHRPDFASQQAQFYSLETLRLTGYDKVLFCDSDLLFRRSIGELFETHKALICCGDALYRTKN